MVVYTQPECSFCEPLKQGLRKAGANFEVVDISEDSAAYEDLVRRGVSTTPVIKTDEGEYITRRHEMMDLTNKIKKANRK
ncbi:glutaredoxin [Gordonia phage Ronaldo]|uniref:NrdH-like glutaredoxin n=4 Tax=Ronaldovirus TaxID=2733205 RepID=A0A6B9LJW5_9CAUD|nr:NrdH-like glutaredoxin [Gordonia phage Fryberger]YP_009807814.1 glutaredoxin [Gordonia phage Ronaldo]QDH48457.1 NrdH-like glutaredoxin [Gordonia phage Ziko]QHB38234.1 NrdH-like glutaredoxin [Gordonia phage Volt]QTF81904.1 NrdH-like glutaredoxin [Gordonia phage Guey18]AXN53532.1 NrdH-like glutaredoxin [Gordonia phage Fryberger]AXN53680.1 NrdH-like glutaredoxin [Gordonia phage Ronaldo]